MIVYYRRVGAARARVYEQVGPAEFCCPDMAGEWDVLVGFGVRGVRRTSSREVNIFAFRPDSAVAGITEIRYCPWCGTEIRVRRAR